MPAWIKLARNALFAATAAFAAALPIGAAQGQDLSQLAGQWSCKYAMEPFSGNAMDKHYWEFQLALYPQGQYQMQGFYYNPVVGQIPVQGEGQWGPQQGPTGPGIKLQGRQFRQDQGWGPFQMVAQVGNAQTLYMQFRGNTHMTNVNCQR